tara:strand:- start:3526 stop:4023 length:498 start_codon:yes stop_codon:yes gene_type:complete
MIQKLTSYASLLGVVAAIGGGFMAWGEFNNRIAQLENKEFVINETVDLAPINDKISTLEVEILDRMSALEDEWMARDNDSLDDISTDILTAKSDSINRDEKLAAADKEMMKKMSEFSSEVFKEFGKIRDLINDLNKKIAVAEKQSELNGILIEEIKEQASNPLGG